MLEMFSVLFSGHSFASLWWVVMHLVSCLYHSAESAKAHHQYVIACRPLDALHFSDFSSDLEEGDNVADRHDGAEATHEAALAHFLGRAAPYYARTEIAPDAEAAVVEAAEETVAPFTHDDWLFFDCELFSNREGNREQESSFQP